LIGCDLNAYSNFTFNDDNDVWFIGHQIIIIPGSDPLQSSIHLNSQGSIQSMLPPYVHSIIQRHSLIRFSHLTKWISCHISALQLWSLESASLQVRVLTAPKQLDFYLYNIHRLWWPNSIKYNNKNLGITQKVKHLFPFGTINRSLIQFNHLLPDVESHSKLIWNAEPMNDNFMWRWYYWVVCKVTFSTISKLSFWVQWHIY